ncbi:MAG: helix-turn-helix domain-containing protein, partial [Nocardioides sp.]|nr:helix-turn-helix domain-containing protein [Nocardioides sp.]
VLVSRGDVARRLAEAGWGDNVEHVVVVVAIDAGAGVQVDEVVAAAEECWTSLGGAHIVGAVGSHVIVLLNGGRRVAPQRLRGALTEDATRLQALLDIDAAPLVGVAAPVTDMAHTSRSVGSARDVLRSAQRHGIRRGVVMARDVGVQRLLSDVPAAKVTDLITEQIGTLIEQDRTHGADLVRTLGLYLACGMSKTATAELLGIRRQSLYARLERIERLLGISLADPAHRAGLDLALMAWQMRTGADPQTAFAGPRTLKNAQDPASGG